MSDMTEPPQCMPDDAKIVGSSLDAYRNYYIKYKHEFAKWKMGNIPSWYSDNLKKTENEIKKFNHKDVEGYRKLLKFSEKIFNVGFLKLSFTPFHNFWFMIKQLPTLLILKRVILLR